MATTSPSAQDESIVNRILELEAQRCAGLIAGHLDGYVEYEKMLSDDLVYTHASGKVDLRASHISGRQAAANHYLKFEEEDQCVRVYHSLVAVLTGRIRNSQKLGDGQKMADNRFTSVWVRSSTNSDDWRFASYHACAIVPQKK